MGLSRSTVSKVLGNQSENRVSEKVARQVRSVAAMMGYQPNHAARALRTGKTSLIGLIIPRIGIAGHQGFYHDMYMGILNSTSESEYAIVQLLLQPRKKLQGIIYRGLLDGILFITSDPDNSDVDFLVSTKRPLVVVNREVTHSNTSFIAHEYEQAAREVTRDLVQQGHRRLALLAGRQTESNQRLIKGFQEEMRELSSQGVSGVQFDIPESAPECYVHTAWQVVRNGPFDAYIVDIARQAEILCQVAKEETGQTIGRNKDLVVFSPEENTVMSEITPWRLYLHQNELMGRQAYSLLMDQMDASERKTQRCYVPFRIVKKD